MIAIVVTLIKGPRGKQGIEQEGVGQIERTKLGIISFVLSIVSFGLIVWAISLKSDLDEIVLLISLVLAVCGIFLSNYVL